MEGSIRCPQGGKDHSFPREGHQEVAVSFVPGFVYLFCVLFLFLFYTLNEMSRLIHSLYEYLLCASYVPGVGLGAGDIGKPDKNLPS